MSSMTSVKENEKLIEDFIKKINLKHPNYYPVISALNALDNNNELQEHFIKTKNDDFCEGELILRLYGLLQGLFVSIDALYSLAYALTNSKSFININQNPDLRQLKYLRNDVVGHPTNRVYNNAEVGYCILPKENIKAIEFDYHIYTKHELKTKRINMLTVLNNYYLESNKLLRDIDKIYEGLNIIPDLSKSASNIYNNFSLGKKIITEINELKKDYLSAYQNADYKQHRFLWRIALIEKLSQINSPDEKTKDLINYSIMFELIKLNELANTIEKTKVIKLNNKLKLPRYLSGFYKMLNNHPKIIDTTAYLHDMTHPLFTPSLKKCFLVANEYSLKDALGYLSIIEKYFLANDSDLVYAIGILAKQYKRK